MGEKGAEILAVIETPMALKAAEDIERMEMIKQAIPKRNDSEDIADVVRSWQCAALIQVPIFWWMAAWSY